MNVVRGEPGVAQRREERAHLSLRKLFSRLDRSLAGDRGGKSLVLRRSPRNAVARQRVECLAQAALGVEARVRHRHRIHDQSVAAEALHLETQPLEIVPVRVESLALRRAEMQCEGQEQSLRGSGSAFKGVHELLVQHALMSRVLIDEDQAVLVLEGDVGAAKLEQWRHHRGWSDILGGRRPPLVVRSIS